MREYGSNIILPSLDNLFSSEQERQDAKLEKIQILPLSELHPFEGHPFQVRDDELMQDTVDSIQKVGILNPVILRSDDNGGYEMISGHRRMYAADFIGMKEIPAIVRDMTDDEAVIFMVDSNLQREEILPSERAKAYKMKLEAIKRQAGRPAKENGDHVGHHLSSKKSVEIIADESGASKSQVQRFIRLNELHPKLQQLVDEKKIGLTPAVEISYLKPEEQSLLLDTIDSEQATPSLSQAQRMKKLSAAGELNDDNMLAIMMEQKKPENWNITLPMDRIKKFFPRSYTPQQMESTIFKLLEAWQKKRQRLNER